MQIVQNNQKIIQEIQTERDALIVKAKSKEKRSDLFAHGIIRS